MIGMQTAGLACEIDLEGHKQYLQNMRPLFVAECQAAINWPPFYA